MSQKRCPHCGEIVQSNSLTCPKCFKTIQREEYVERRERSDERKGSGKVPTAAVLLAVFPPLVGLLGLGAIYLEPKRKRGYAMLIIGLVLYVSLIALLFTILGSGIVSAIFLLIAFVIILLIYISAAIAAFFETLFGSVFRVLKF
jgi:hypothetical protein